MTRWWRAIATVLIALAWAQLSAADPFAHLAVASEDELADTRGGIRFYFDGLEIRIAISVETRVDQELLLRTEVGTEDLRGHPGTGEAQNAAGQPAAALAEPRLEVAGDPTKTQVIHRVGLNDLTAVVRNRVDGITIQTIGQMEIEIPNFREREAEIRSSLAAQGVSLMLDDASARSLQR